MRYVLLLLIVLVGCVAHLTEDEQEWQRMTDRENWLLCYQVIRHMDRAMVYVNYTGSVMPSDWGDVNRLTPFQVKELLNQNRCRQGLGKHWMEY